MITRLCVLTILLAAQVCCADDKKPSHSLVGTKNEKGNLIIHVYGPAAEPRFQHPVALETDFGVLMCRSSERGTLFVIADRAKTTVREFSSYSDYLEALHDVPVDSVLTIYDVCSMPRFHDFYPVHFELYKKFKRDCGERGLKLAKEPKLTCTCSPG